MAENLGSNLLKNREKKHETKRPIRSISGRELRCSLPCNVNSGEASRDFLEEAKQKREVKDRDYAGADHTEKEPLIENDLLARGYEERLIDGGGPSRASSSLIPVETHVVSATPNYTSKATFQISNRASNVDDPVSLNLDNVSSEKSLETNNLTKVAQQSKYQVIIPTYPVKAAGVDEKKVDENGNALHQTKEKKKKKQSDKNVVVLKSENIEGHKSDIINDVDELLQFIEGTTENNVKSRSVQSKQRQLHKQHTSEDGSSKQSKKRHPKAGLKEGQTGVSGEEGRHELKKSNSLGEISGMKLDRDFEAFSPGKNKKDKEEENVVLRGNKPMIDRTRERRSWGTVEAHSYAMCNASSLETLETASDNWEVTRPKKKSKKRRNSVSSASGARQHSSTGGTFSVGSEDRKTRRALSPDLGAVIIGVSNIKTTRSMPHSEKSNDSSSDIDSVHSLPMDGPISYADIAKNSEKKKSSPEKQERSSPASKEKSPQVMKQQLEIDTKNSTLVRSQTFTSPMEKSLSASTNNNSNNNNNNNSVSVLMANQKITVPDVHNIKSFPAITGTNTKTTVASTHTQIATMTTSDKAVQSTLSYEETFMREKATPLVDSSSQIPRGPVTGHRKISNNNNNNINANLTRERTNKGGTGLQDSTGSEQNSTVQGFFGAHSDARSELPLFSQLMSMRDAAHFVAQRMPPDIMDVSTIEKMQFMNCASGMSPSASSAAIHNNAGYSNFPNAASTSMDGSAIYYQTNVTKGKRKKGQNNNTMGVTSNVKTKRVAEKIITACDTSYDEEKRVAVQVVNGIADDKPIFSLEHPLQPSAIPAIQQNMENSPPVVILSGLPKEIPTGLVFGFDINEQLLLEDSEDRENAIEDDRNPVFGDQENNTNVRIERLPCLREEWARRYRPPANERSNQKQNHDRIVSFISAAWENVLSQQIPYYSDSL